MFFLSTREIKRKESIYSPQSQYSWNSMSSMLRKIRNEKNDSIWGLVSNFIVMNKTWIFIRASVISKNWVVMNFILKEQICK